MVGIQWQVANGHAAVGQNTLSFRQRIPVYYRLHADVSIAVANPLLGRCFLEGIQMQMGMAAP